MDEYRQFLRIPNVSADSVNIRKNPAFIVQMMQHGIPAQLLDGPAPGTTPAVFGEIKTPGAVQTLIFYAHYDGQPVNPKQWTGGLQPFDPVFITAPIEQGGTIATTYKPGDALDPAWRLTGRGSANDKAGVANVGPMAGNIIPTKAEAVRHYAAEMRGSIRTLMNGRKSVECFDLVGENDHQFILAA